MRPSEPAELAVKRETTMEKLRCISDMTDSY